MGAWAVAAAQTLAVPGCSGLAAGQPAQNSSGAGSCSRAGPWAMCLLLWVPPLPKARPEGPGFANRCSREMHRCPLDLGDAGGAARGIPSLHVLWAGSSLPG